MIAFWVLVIGGAVWLVVTLARGSQGSLATPVSGQTPLAILQARYAKGEITKEQFDTLKRDVGV
ncbi:MAG: SHOCT domain-containing protein [Chloroflexi bacterium]|nr:SHOCT domain-containing protein [Chloroflexota bacterium]MBI5653108.1 SHOCT domain-containing protein [Chloroflexota bacterium]